jgi:hypothetical protein
VSDLVSQLKKRVKASPLAKLLPAASSPAKNLKDVFVGLASIPTREHSLEQVVASLLPQVAGLGVYLNNWENVPNFLKNPKIQVARSQDHGDVRDNGKFFFIDKTNATFYATVDDDIAYPKDYIATLVRHQQKLGGTYAVGVHAAIYPTTIKKLLRQRYLWHFAFEAPSLLPVDMIGTGTLLFERAYWQLEYSEIGTPGMADVWFAVAAKKRNYGLWVVPREAGWMASIEQEDPQANLFNEGRLDDSEQVKALTAAKVGSTRRSLLEQLVRVPKLGSEFSVEDADALAIAANKLSIDELEEVEFRLFDYALATHKRESNKNMDARLNEVIDKYVEFLLHRASGRIYANDIDFENDYKALLKELGLENLPVFARRDWDYLKVA